MSNHLKNLLSQWYPQRDSTDWVLGTIFKTEGPCYRKAGAMMLFNGLGQQFGMLSGGCLESDIQTHARKVMQRKQSITLCYDGSDEDDLSFQLGIGCGGTVHILLQPIHASNTYLQLDRVHHALQQRTSGHFLQKIITGASTGYNAFEPGPVTTGSARLQQMADDSQLLVTPITAPPHLLIVGGGLDARPVVAMAHQLGWQISLWDPRPANGRAEFFMEVDQLLSGPAAQLAELDINAAILMSHNIRLDAEALQALQANALDYLALLGPTHRKAQVIEQAGISEHALSCALAGPAGLSIGGELPESIALSILSECHAALHQRRGESISGVLR